jgi:hypothetical protein|tara:strand:+ start:2272 stop:2766 length:495 start_codon:yes stop_codon:yes gene_type:complete
MAFLGQTFDIDDMPEAETQDFSPVPAGWYNVNIAGADVRTTKAGTGEYIALRFDITGPTHQGRVVWTNLNTKNPNPLAEDIAHQNLRQIMNAIGLKRVEDSDQLIGGNLSVKVTVKDDPKYGPGNEVKGYKAIEGSAPPAAVAQVATVAATPADSSAAPPWVAK